MRLFRLALSTAIYLAWTATAIAEQRTIDTRNSVLTVRAYKAGVFSAFAGHDHEISAPIASGTADVAAQRVELQVNASALRVRDPKVSDKDRAEIQQTMLGPEVLDVERYPKIVFRSTSADPSGANSWRVQGTLTLHGQTQPVTVEVREQAGRYIGSARFRQTAFGIKPVRVAGGTIRVKDEIRIEFDVSLAP